VRYESLTGLRQDRPYQCDVVDADMTSAARRREQTTGAPANTCRECVSVRRYAVVASQTERHPDVVD